MGSDQRPDLTPSISRDDFLKYYWLKEELLRFCRAQGLPTWGAKEELTHRIDHFLTNGETIQSSRPAHKKRRIGVERNEISLETMLTKGYTNSEINRAFFKSVIGPEFHFTTRFMRFCREHPEATYGDAVMEWRREREERKTGKVRTEIAPQFEYNRFIRDFFEDPAHHGKSLSEAIAAWRQYRAKPRLNSVGSRRFQSS